jgi:hypothetical protein
MPWEKAGVKERSCHTEARMHSLGIIAFENFDAKIATL